MRRKTTILAGALLLALFAAGSAGAEVLRLEKELFYGLAALTPEDKDTLPALRAGNQEVFIRNVTREGRSVRILIDTLPGKTAVIELSNNEIYSLPNFTPPNLANEIMRRSGSAIEVSEIRRTGTAVEFVLSFVAEAPPPSPAPRPEPKPAPRPDPPPRSEPAPKPVAAAPPKAVPQPVAAVPMKPASPPPPAETPKAAPAPKPSPAPAAPAEKPVASSPDTLTVERIAGAGPLMDGRGADPAWKDARPLVAELVGRRGVFVTGKALTDGDMIYLLLSWNDPDEDTVNRPWIWDAGTRSYRQGDQLDDGVTVQFSMGASRKGGESASDLWVWRAGREGRGDYATDATLTLSKKPLPNSSYLELENGTGVWLRQAPDEGRLPYERQLPLEFRGDQLPGYIVRQPEGSAANVRTRANYANGRWTVEFMRKLDTRHPDDAGFVPGKPLSFQVSILEKEEDNLGHFTGALTLNWGEGAGRKGR